MIEIFEAFILSYGSIAVFFMGVLEELIFVLPSAIVFLGAGFLLIPPEVNFWQALGEAFLKIGLPAGAGVAFGSMFIYGLVYWGGKPMVEKYGRYVGLTWADIEGASKRFAAGYYDEVLLVVLRALPIFPISVISAACGLVRIPWNTFLFYTFVGASIRAGGSALVGWLVGIEYEKYAAQFEIVEKYGLIVLLILGGLAYWYLRKHFRK